MNECTSPGNYQVRKDSYLISTDKSRLELDVIYNFITKSYWAKGRSQEVIKRTIENSICFGVYENGRQIGFARVVSDRAIMAYIMDLFILESHRARGLSKWLMECILNHPELREVRRWVLNTRDAHGLYARFGFQPISKPEFAMERVEASVYNWGD